MVQGKTNGIKTKAPSSRHAQKAAANTKKGRKYVPPKKPILIKQAQAQKTLSAKIGKSIEHQMVSAASSGKLTIMKNVAPEASPSTTKDKASK